jgi:hypothetical protein
MRVILKWDNFRDSEYHCWWYGIQDDLNYYNARVYPINGNKNTMATLIFNNDNTSPIKDENITTPIKKFLEEYIKLEGISG